VGGPPIFLAARAVQNIGFALHELATNASKHGALSTTGGYVVISWSAPGEDDRIRLEWAERGGPSVHSPTRQGFGHAMLTKLVAEALEGTSALEFSSDGLRWELDIPGSNALRAPVTKAETLREPSCGPSSAETGSRPADAVGSSPNRRGMTW
jgi:two-component sensor histidine kinase